MESKVMIPNVKKKPDWANYWAQDIHGIFWWTEKEPVPGKIDSRLRIEQVKIEDMICVTIYPLETAAKA